jgi:hypothetical protein
MPLKWASCTNLKPNWRNEMNDLFTHMETAPAVSAPSIASSAMFAELSIGNWTARKLDRKATKETTSANGASDDAGAFHKKLLSCPELEAIQKHIANTRQNIHYRLTMPWSDLGVRLLPTAMFADYYREITEAETEFHRLVNEFLQAYTWSQAQAQARLGNLFSSDDYPSVEIVAAKFRFRHSQTPIPDVGDFRLDIGAQAQDSLRKQYSDFYSQQLNNAMSDVWERTYKSLAHMSEKLDYVGKEDKKTFRDTLVENVREMLGLLTKFNVTNDQRMENMRVRLEDAMLGVSADALRDDDSFRLDTKTKVDAILKSMNW